MSEVERARAVLAREREDVLRGLRSAAAAQRREAEEAARRQAAWRDAVGALLERGRAAGVPVVRMAEALGVSRQWATHLMAERTRKRGAHPVVPGPLEWLERHARKQP